MFSFQSAADVFVGAYVAVGFLAGGAVGADVGECEAGAHFDR